MLRKTAEKRRKPQESARCRSISQHPITTLQELLESIRNQEPEQAHLRSMLAATVAHISMVLGEPPDKIDIRRLLDVKPGLQDHLRLRGFKRNSIRSYTNYLRILRQKAGELGWTECSPELASAWESARRATSKAVGCSEIIRYAIQNAKKPSDFSESDLTNWAEAAVERGRRFEYIVTVKSRFRNRIFQAELGSEFPNLLPPRKGRKYGIPMSEFPEPLQSQVTDLLRWKTAEFAPERPIRAKNRPISARSLKGLISRLFGFVVGVRARSVVDLRELLNYESVVEFVDWSVNQRGNSGRCLWVEIGRIGGLRAYPGLDGHDFSWLPKLMAQLPREQETRVEERYDRKWVPYEVLAKIPDQIRRDAAAISDLTENKKAQMARDALLIAWLTTLPWRQLNIRECKVLPFIHGGNLSREEIPPHSVIAKPKWVEDALRTNPRQRFWQFYFRPLETKTGRAVRGVLPRQLLPLLEEYLDRHRAVLLGGHTDPNTLFCNGRGHPFGRNDLLRLTGAITMKYAGRRVNPHLFRHIFAVRWLEDHPEGYLTLSKILWHSNINTTIRIYSRNYDESYGARCVDEWQNALQRGKTAA